jgi:NTE family protein
MSEHEFSRRHFLGLLAGALPSLALPWSAPRAGERPPAGATRGGRPTVGIALGAGGANGLAHIQMLEVLDELGVRPARITGSSIGAVIGALYASGKTGRQIRELVEQFLISPDEGLVEELLDRDALRWVEFIEIDLGHGGLLSSEGFISFLYDTLGDNTFEELEIPLGITAADLWEREEVVLQSGPLLPAIKASMALPGVFQPEIIGERVLIDGGTVNPVPYDLLTGKCDIVIGIDVSGVRTRPEAPAPGYFETVFNAAKVMQHAIMTEKLRHGGPAIYLAPRIVDIRALEFYRAREVWAQAAPAREELMQRLSKLLEA